MAGVIIFPTDTVYGIGCKIFDKDSIDRIYKIKKRDYSKPLACLCANIEQIKEIAYVNDKAKYLIDKYLPGGLTIILKSKEIVKNTIGYETIGVRIPNHKVALTILNENGPMLTTSVNDSGFVPLNEYDEIVLKYKDLVDKIYKTDTKSSNISSTVIMCVDDDVKVLRKGEIDIFE